MATQKKIDTVTELTQKIAKAKTMVLADYRGLKHKQLEELRKTLKKTQGEFVVTKNRLLKKALGDKAKAIEATLNDSTATLFAYADEVVPLRELLKFFKIAGAGSPKSGFLGGTVLNESDITTLASLPSRQMLLAKLVGQLNAPIQRLHYALSWNMNRLVWALDKIKSQKNSNYS